MNAEALAVVQRGGSKRDSVSDTEDAMTGAVAGTEEKTGGRPEKPDDEKSDKTIQNKESM
jgi:hypothetical protein